MASENSVDGQALIRLIDRYTEGVKRRTVTCSTPTCRHCGFQASGERGVFLFHGTRPRRFLIQVGAYVHTVHALLSRWRCPRCRRTFTEYPSFACPHKAYTLPQMTERAAGYVRNPATSYRKGVCFANLPIFHEKAVEKTSVDRSNEDAAPCPTVAHTSLFHWVTALGAEAMRSSSTRQVAFLLSPRKYTSERRRSILMECYSISAAYLRTTRWMVSPRW